MSLVHLDGYTVNVEDVAGTLEIIVRRVADGKAWRGSCGDIEGAITLANRIVEDQQLIQQMKEGDHHAAH